MNEHQRIKERLIATDGGSLDDPESVEILRAAAAEAELWSFVAPTVKDALFLPTLKMQTLGGSLDDLFAAVLDSLHTLSHPANRNRARSMTAIEHVELSLEWHLRNREDDELRRGRASAASVVAATNAKMEKADEAVQPLVAEIAAAKQRGITKNQAMLAIANREHISVAAIKQRLKRKTHRDKRKK